MGHPSIPGLKHAVLLLKTHLADGNIACIKDCIKLIETEYHNLEVAQTTENNDAPRKD